MAEKTTKIWLIKISKVLGWTVGIILFTITCVILSIRLPFVQDELTQRAIVFLKGKIGTEVTLNRIYISFPKNIELEGLYLEDQTKDTLLSIESLSVNADLWALTKNQIYISALELQKARASVNRSSLDSAFNFDYIINAFTDSVSTDTSSASPWTLSLEKLRIKDVSFSYKDDLLGNQLNTQLGSLKINMDEFDPSSFTYKANSIEWTDSDVYFTQTNSNQESSEIPENDTGNNYNISFENLNLSRIHLKYVNTSLQQSMDANLSEFKVKARTIDLTNHSIDLAKVELYNSFFSLTQYGGIKKETNLKTDSDSTLVIFPLDWKINLSKIELKENSLQYYDFSKAVVSDAFDANHMWLRSLQLDVDNVQVDKDQIQASLNNLSFNEKNGFTLQSLSGEFNVSDKSLNVNSFQLKTQHSNIHIKTHVEFESLSQLVKHYQHAKFELDMPNSYTSLKEVLYFAPTILDSVPLQLPKDLRIGITANMGGTVNNLLVSKFHFQTLTNTSVDVHGSIQDLLNSDRMRFNATVDKVYTSKLDLESVLPDSVIPTSIQLPEWILLTGKFNGTMNEPTAHGILTSDAGKIEIDYKPIKSLNSGYDVNLTMHQFALGEILKQKEIGKIDLDASLKGSGFKMETLQADARIHIKNFEYSNYEYHDFILNGNIKNYFFTGNATLKDKNIDFELTGDLDYRNQTPHYALQFNLRNIDLQQLNLSERPLKARATVEVDLATSDLKVTNGTLNIRKVAIYNGSVLYKVDSLLFASIDQEGESELSIRSDILSGDFKGTFNILHLPTVLKQHVNHYFRLQDSTVKNFTEETKFKFDMTIHNTDLLTDVIFPELDSFVPGKIQGEFDSNQNTLTLGIEIAKLKYASTSLDSFILKINSDKEALHFGVALNDVSIDTLHVTAIQINGKISHDSIGTNVIILDSLKQNKYRLGGFVRSTAAGFQYSFIPGKVMLNYKDWSTSADNYLQLNSSGMVAHNFNLTNNNEKFSVVTNAKDSTVSFEFIRWNLENLTQLVDGVIPASGQLDGNFKLTTAHRGEFNSTIKINELAILEKKWGDATLSLSHRSNRYSMNLQVIGENTKLMAKGFVSPEATNTIFDIDLSLSPFDLALIEPLSSKQLKNVKGELHGDIKLSGNMNEPTIRGKLTFKEVSFLNTYLNNSFSLKNETIAFQNDGIEFSNFKIADEKKNEATIKGSILTKSYKDFDFNLKVNARHFQLLNTKEEDNTLYYGKLLVNINATIGGNINNPSIDAALKVDDESQLTYVVPTEEKNALEQKGIVRFVSKREEVDPFLKNISLQDTTQSLFQGINVDATIELTEKSILNIVVDPQTGDKLSLKGNSTLVFNSEASGNTNLSGRYEITSGTYNFSFYKFVKREFEIVKGSSITWSGNPLNAAMDLRALYAVDASPLDLVYNQLTATNKNEINSYNQRLPFLVYLIIKGELLVPQISFAIDMPEDKRNVFGGAIYAKLQDLNTRESDLNKQVFALLILKRFISENPLESQAGSSLNNTTRVSVSRILTEQLNRLSENVKGVQLNFDLKSYENYNGTEVQGQTKVQLGLSKNLFNDRLVVKVSGNVDIEGETTQQDVTDYIGDLALEYKLTPDGRIRVTGFRTSNYDMIDGELTEAGAGLIYIKDYNTFRELFKANAKTN